MKVIALILVVVIISFLNIQAKNDKKIDTKSNIEESQKYQNYNRIQDSIKLVKIPIVYRVINDFHLINYNFSNPKLYSAGLGDCITLFIKNLNEIVNLKDKDVSQLVPVIDGYKIYGCHPILIDTLSHAVKFQLIRLEGDSTVAKNNCYSWSQILGHPKRFNKSVTVSISYEDGLPFNTMIDKRENSHHKKHKPYSLQLNVIDKDVFFICLVVFSLVLLAFLFFASNTELLKVTPQNLIAGHRNPYSLSLSQLAFWFILIVASTMFLYLITGTYLPLPSSVLTILGISSITSLSAKGIETIKTKKEKGKKDNESSIEGVKKHYNFKYKGIKYNINEIRIFLKDILSDQSGISFYRFQVLVWTLLFGFYFLVKVWDVLTIPEIDSSMLILMGMTSFTYLGGKFQENKAPVKKAANTSN